MGFFSKKRDKEKNKNNFDIGDKNLERPSLPDLPTLKLPEIKESAVPSLPSLSKKKKSLEHLNALPSLPDNSFGEKLSQDTIKSVVGEKEDSEKDDIEKKETLLHKSPPLVTPISHKLKGTKEGKPIFVKLDKFEQGIEIFKKTKLKVSEIESTLANIKQIREEEQKQLSYWEEELQKIKNDISVIEENIFSKIE